MKLTGKASWFGGPDDMGVSPSEGLAFIYELDDAPGLFLPEQPPGTTGLARRLNPEKYYVACRWDYSQAGTSKEELLSLRVLVRAKKTGKFFIARPADWGPHEDTDRVADLSPGLLEALGITTDDEVDVFIPVREVEREQFSVVMSVGHGEKIRGASGILDEVDEAQKVVDKVAQCLKRNGVDVTTFFDTTSTDQQTNLETICDYHNAQPDHDLDVSVHFNCYNGQAHGTECLYVSQDDLAGRVAEGIAEVSDITNRGAKYNGGLYFLNNTNQPAILIEVCFVDSSVDAELYRDNFDVICMAIADAITPA